MRKFLTLCEEFDPNNATNPKWVLIDFLKSKGINVSVIQDTDMLYIDTGEQTIVVTVDNNSEEEEDPAYNVDQEVEKLANKANSGAKGMAAKMLGTGAQKAKSATKKRQNLAKKAVDVYDQSTKNLEKSIQQASTQIRQ